MKVSKRVLRSALAFVTVMIGLLAAMTAVDLTATAATPSATVDEAVTSGTNRFTYTGTWVSCGGCNPGAYNNSFKYSGATGATVTFTFSGTQAVLYGYKEKWGGIAGVSVDGGASTDLDFYAPNQLLTAVYTSPSLAAGVHTVKLTVTGRSTGGSRTINVDKADVFTVSAPPTTTTTTTTAPTTTTPPTTTAPPTTTTTTTVPTTTTTSAPTSSGPPVSVDDAITSGTNRFSYSGTWTACGGCNAGAYNNSFRYASTTGASVTLTFTGTQAVLYGYKEQWGGIAAVSLDGGASVDRDFYATSQSLTSVYTSPVLSAGTHTLTMSVTGRTSGSSRTINIDKADVHSSGGTPPTSSSSTTTSGSTTTTTSTSTSTSPPPSGNGIASLSFDDGQIGQYRNARPAMRSGGVNGTFYIISDALGWGTQSNMSPTEVKQLAAEGDEIGSHTRDHSNLTSLSSSGVEAEFADAQAAIKSQTGVTPTTCAYPYGASNASVRTIAAKYLKACRGTTSGTNSLGALAPFDLVVYYVHTGDGYAQIKAAADAAKAANVWVIFVYHGVGAIGSNEDVSPAAFADHVRALKDSGISVRTVSAGFDAMSG